MVPIVISTFPCALVCSNNFLAPEEDAMSNQSADLEHREYVMGGEV
jgi:hypothetical protein